MVRWSEMWLAVWLGLLAGSVPAEASVSGGAMQAASQSGLCKAAVSAAELARHVPQAFLAAIARVESGRADPQTGQAGPWPWTVNAEGAGHFYDSKAEAVTAVLALQARGVRSIDVGCLQVNLLHHPEAFASLDQAFDPQANATYAAGFLAALFAQMGSWPLAAAAYHSQTPTVGAPYEKLVLDAWAEPDGTAHGRHGRGRAVVPASEKAGDSPVVAEQAGGVAPAPFRPAGRPGAILQSGPAPARLAGQAGRSLAAYRLMPTRLAFRLGPPG